MPPFAGPPTECDSEVDGLEKDLLSLGQGSLPSNVILLGDANVQPSILGGGPDPHPDRGVRLQQVIDRWQLVLLNPGLAGLSSQSLRLPLRIIC